MVGLNLRWVVGLGLPALGVHLVAVALTKALRTYSRSRLEEVTASRGHPGRADDVAHHDEATERAADGVAVVTGVFLAALLGASATGFVPGRSDLTALAVGATVLGAGYLMAGAVGRIYAERVVDRLWPLAGPFRTATAPIVLARRASEHLVSALSRPGTGPPRPASVEVEIPADGDRPEDADPELPEPVRAVIQNVVELSRRDVSELMIPRSSVVALPASVSTVAAARTFRETGLSRIPVYGENRDDVLGVLYAKDLFSQLTDPDSHGVVVPRALARPAHFIPETKNAFDLLEEFRARRLQIAIVLDEYGGVAGLITLEDLVEELVGTIDDEHDAPTASDPLVPLGDARYEVDATLELEELNERLGLDLPTDGDFLTVGGLAFHALGRVPEPGASFRYAGAEFTVVEVADHAIRRVRIDLHPRAAVGSQ